MRRTIKISVGPVEGGWAIRCDRGMQPMMFLSGGRAEQQARALARRLSDNGEDAEVRVHDRSNALIGAVRFAAPMEAA